MSSSSMSICLHTSIYIHLHENESRHVKWPPSCSSSFYRGPFSQVQRVLINLIFSSCVMFHGDCIMIYPIVPVSTLEKEMATHSSVLAWRIPGPGEPGGLPSMGLHRVRHDWSDLAAAAALVHIFSFFLGFSLNIFIQVLLCSYTVFPLG